ncbi:asparagine synthase (glutamine-hydrolyzing) [Streptomyces pacificus]|uniref:asparagine synthase (glutamine-hydrolyzing) n=1 Tax=Streptomyces pacificus TaxID=2705029 RepID=A0A6A0B3Z1_9ACTN|nr:asparagine synthase (glutamine-hydrolyzing) [Streptomyces pacificus]GFH39415.1 asparagine synthase (glutamine-hydrolyzing) [Streptomyces pacificus]
MCGIAGAMGLRNGVEVDSRALARMTATLLHRGPDSGGVFAEDGVGLGFRRLSINDLGGGAQPMSSEDGAVVVVCNGEIFNHRRLRAELVGRGHRFRTDCDVEVLVHLYEEEGTELLHRLNGQFAFAILDRPRRRLFLARDHVGVLPLHYATTADHFVFGSEAKAVLEHPGVDRAVDLTGLDQVLTFPGLVSPRTMFQGVSSLRAGHYLLVEDGAVREVPYWDLDYPSAGELAPRPDAYYAERLRELLTGAVRRRLDADVPVGFYLSGGLDSSLIAGLVGELAPPADSFSVTFPDAEIDESGYQRLMAQKAGSRHHEVRFTTADIAEDLHRMVLHAETPVKETYNTCSLALARRVRESGTTVILTGEGADELFGGYVGYRFDRLGRGAGSSGDDLADALEDDVRRRLWGDAGLFYERRYHAWREAKLGIYSAGVREAFRDVDCLRLPPVDPARLAGRDPLDQRSYLDFRLRLSDHLLSDHGDRMAMAHSVEARYPFLDREVVEFATEVPARLKVHPLGEKYVVRQAAQGLVPPEIIDREKFGFRAPGSPALLRAGVEWVGDMLSPARIRRQGYFDPAAVERLRARYTGDGFEVHPHYGDDLLLTVLTFGILLDTFSLPDHS